MPSKDALNGWIGVFPPLLQSPFFFPMGTSPAGGNMRHMIQSAESSACLPALSQDGFHVSEISLEAVPFWYSWTLSNT